MKRLLRKSPPAFQHSPASRGPGSVDGPASPDTSDSEDDQQRPNARRPRNILTTTQSERQKQPAKAETVWRRGRGGGQAQPLALVVRDPNPKLRRKPSVFGGLKMLQPASASTSSTRFLNAHGEVDGGAGGNHSGFGARPLRDGMVKANLYEGEPLLPEEVADYIRIDFRDGTGPSALPPNDVTRAFRDAEDFALFARGTNAWAGLKCENDGAARAGGGGRDGREAECVGRGRGKGKRRHVVHVESATTGTFFKVFEGEGGAGTRGTWGVRGSSRRVGEGVERESRGEGHGAGGAGDGGGGGFAENEVRAAERLGIPVREVSLMRLNKGLEAGVFLVQGALAGLSLGVVYTALLAESLDSFVAAYEAESGEFRRAMFLLCTLALMGTEDQLFQAKGNGEVWARLSWSGRLELRVCVFLYGGCLVSTLVCAVADTVIANARGLASSVWYVAAFDDETFRQKVLLWYGFNLARFVLAWVGWFLVCRRGWRASLRSDESRMELTVQSQKLTAAEDQIARLNGRNLDPLTTKELQELRISLKRALNHAERMIDLRYQRETPIA